MKTLLPLLFAVASLSACAQDGKPPAAAKPAAVAPGTPAASVRAALLKLDSKMPIESIEAAPLKGFQQVIVGGRALFVSNDGKYLMQGTLYDIARQADVGEEAMQGLRAELLRTIPLKDRIVFAPPNPKYTVTVFTDVECGYCRKMHGEIAEYNRLGIAVQYVAFPRMGLASEDFRKMVAVWCSADRKQALTDAKNERPVTSGQCTNPVTMQYVLGQRMGLTGTPMVLTADGTQLGGYVPPAQMRAMLDQLAGGGSPAASTATGSP
ncbi:MAG: DsbC family protein [Pseudomonadota bacterium]|nr:DsbC family protein [Pseudomonadota bacterium]